MPDDETPPAPRRNSRDGMLDKISEQQRTIAELRKKRKSTLNQIEGWEVAQPELAEVLDDIRLHLL